MLLDLYELEADESVQCDICIVGGGAVGLAMAAKLARNNRNTVVLEGGGTSLETASQNLQRGSSAGQPFQNIEVGRYRVLGGTTTFWGGQVIPLGQHAMQARPWVAPRGWPLESRTLEPYFEQAYRLLGLAKVEIDDLRIWNRLRVSPELDEALSMHLTRWLPQRNFARLFRNEIEKCPTLKVIVHANVTGVTLDETKRRVTRIEARSLGGKKIVVRAHNVVLACGSIEVARLLLHPATDGGDQPWSDNPWVGRAFLDHIHGTVGDVEVLDYHRFHELFDSIYLDGFKYYPTVRLATSLQAKEQTTQVAGQFLYESDFSQQVDHIKMFLRSLRDARVPHGVGGLPSHLMSLARISAPLVWRYIRQGRSYKPVGSKVRLSVSAEQIPNPKSQIRLSRETDAVGMYRPIVDWQLDGREIHSIAVFASTLGASLEKHGLARVHIHPDLESRSPRFFDDVYDGIHQMGGARMGYDATDGVVDSDLKVFGTDNLYVAGQAVFPVSGCANPTFTGIALGLRLCDTLTAATR